MSALDRAAGMLGTSGGGVLVGLLLAAGVLCVWSSCRAPDPDAGSWRRDTAARARLTLVQAGLPSVGAGALAAACVVAGATVALLVLGTSDSPPIAVSFAVLAAWLPVAAVRSRARGRRAATRELWPDVVDHLASGVRAGMSLPEALAQLGERGPAPLRPAFAAFGRDHRATGRFTECLDALKDRLADPVADRICEALRVTREVGGSDLGRLLRSLSAFLRDDARTRAELEARQSWTVNAARLAVAAPWAVLALLSTRPESVRAYDSPAGVTVLAVGAGASVLAYRLMVRIGRLPEEERVLR